MRLLVGVFVPHMPHQLPTGGKVCLAILAPVWFCPCVRVHVVLQRCKSFETTLTNTALVGSFLAVRFHVPRQEVPLGCGVVTIVTHVTPFNTLTSWTLVGHQLHHLGFVIMQPLKTILVVLAVLTTFKVVDSFQVLFLTPIFLLLILLNNENIGDFSTGRVIGNNSDRLVLVLSSTQHHLVA